MHETPTTLEPVFPAFFAGSGEPVSAACTGRETPMQKNKVPSANARQRVFRHAAVMPFSLRFRRRNTLSTTPPSVRSRWAVVNHGQPPEHAVIPIKSCARVQRASGGALFAFGGNEVYVQPSCNVMPSNMARHAAVPPLRPGPPGRCGSLTHGGRSSAGAFGATARRAGRRRIGRRRRWRRGRRSPDRNALRRRCLAAKRRSSIARGVSPWNRSAAPWEAPEGRQTGLSPLRGFAHSKCPVSRGSRPWLVTTVPPGLTRRLRTQPLRVGRCLLNARCSPCTPSAPPRFPIGS